MSSDAAGLPDAPVAISPLASNYGKPRKRPEASSRYPGRRKPAAHPLPPLVAYPGASVAKAARAAPPRPPDYQPPPTVAAIPAIPAKARPRSEADPYAPLGVAIGSLRLTPYVEVDGGYDSNPNRSSPPTKGSPTARTEIGAAIKSDWSTHELKGDFSTGYTKYFNQAGADRPDGRGKLNLRIDATRDTSLDAELHGQLDSQRPGSPDLTAGVKGRPLVATVGGVAGVTQKFGDLEIGLHGTLDRTTYQNATLTNGTPLVLSGDSFNDYGLRTRVGYQVTPGMTPFVEVGVDARRRDSAIDSSGFARNSNGVTARAGSTFELTRQLTGEVAAGYVDRKYADARLQDLRGATFDASLIWSATPLTTVSLKAVTAVNETTVATSSGAISRAATLDISHALLRNLNIGAFATVGANDYQGVAIHETTVSAGLRAEYKLSRSLSIRGSFTHERLHSSTPGSDYTANVFLLGMKFQR